MLIDIKIKQLQKAYHGETFKRTFMVWKIEILYEQALSMFEEDSETIRMMFLISKTLQQSLELSTFL